ncbi:MAG: SUF system NifU family Fe-S cluster assembly protein [Alphaproteobacteria bacterium]|nr:SUF system NifU family Fe-S cluster assembly protein [Alphaproteobacteria bacterium]
MLDELRELYQEVILDHGKNPRNFRAMDNATHKAAGRNPLCGDQLVVYLAVDEDGKVADASFLGKGCAISMASASMMTEMVHGKTPEDAERLFENFHTLCTTDHTPDAPEGLEDEVEKLEVLSGVRQFPSRVKCATLSWHTMDAAIKGEEEISTE